MGSFSQCDSAKRKACILQGPGKGKQNDKFVFLIYARAESTRDRVHVCQGIKGREKVKSFFFLLLILEINGVSRFLSLMWPEASDPLTEREAAYNPRKEKSFLPRDLR